MKRKVSFFKDYCDFCLFHCEEMTRENDRRIICGGGVHLLGMVCTASLYHTYVCMYVRICLSVCIPYVCNVIIIPVV